MPGFLDPSGGLGGGMLDPSDMFDTPEYRRMRMFDTLGNLGAALIQAGAPSRMPSSPFAAVGAALTSDNGSEDRYLKRLLTSSQLQKTRQELANDKAWRDMFSGAGGGGSVDSASWKGVQPAAPTPAGGGGGGSPDQAAFVQMMMPHALEISKQTGLDPRLVIAQSALETGWGASAPGNNYFGVKSHGRPGGQMLATTEAGPGGGLVPTQDSFRTYADPGAAAQDYIEFIKGNAGRYLPVRMAQGLDAQIDAMGKSGYATDPQYGAKLRQIAQGLPQGGPQVAQGDASGNPVQPVQYTPPQAFRPQTMQDVIQTIPEGVRQMIGAMGRKEGMGVLMKYADPGSEAVLDTQSGQVVFIPKTMVGRDPRYQPVEGEKLNLERRRVQMEAANKPVSETGVVNQPYIDAQRQIQAAQGTDPSSKITVELAQDAIKRNSELQKGALTAQSAIGKLGSLQNLLDQISTNKFKGTTTEIKAAAKAAGMDLEAMGVKDDVGPTQAAAALTSLMALENRREMPGPMSNGDRDFLTAAAPAITKDPAGNRILIEIKKGDLQREVDIAKAAREYIASPKFKTNPEGLDDYIASKLEGKNYYNPGVLPQQSIAPPGTLPAPAQPGAPVDLYDKYGLKRK